MPTTPRVIKELIEVASGIPNLSIRNRKRYIVDCRNSYFQLCREFTDTKKYSLEKVGEKVNLNHATVLHGIKTFKNNVGKDSFYANEIYEKVKDRLRIICKDDEPFNALKCMDIELLSRHYRIKHIITTEKYHNVINNAYQKIELLKSSVNIINKDITKEILDLDHENLEILKKRIELFLKVNKSLNKTGELKRPIVNTLKHKTKQL